jgi:hypothetical protein
VVPAGATSCTLQVGVTPQIDTAGRFFLCSPITWKFAYIGNLPSPLFTVTQTLEIYFGPVAEIAPSPMPVENVRFLVCRDLAQPYLTTSTPTAEQTAAACTLGEWNNRPPYVYPIPYPQYGGYWDFELTDWLFALSGLNPSAPTTDCTDSASMLCLILKLQQNPAIQQIFAGRISPVGAIVPATLRGGQQAGSIDFGYHYVAVITSADGTAVCDAAVGPHTGTEPPQQYLDSTFTSTPFAPPSPSQWAVPPGVACPEKVDGQPFPPATAAVARPPALEAMRDTFARRVGLPPAAADAAPVSSAQFDPAAAAPQLARLGLQYQRSSPGTPVSRRYLVFADGSNQAHLKIWESSNGVTGARDRFLDEGGMAESARPYEALPQLGEAAAFAAWTGGQQCLWLYRNLAIRLTVFGEGLDAREIAHAMQQILSASRHRLDARPAGHHAPQHRHQR